MVRNFILLFLALRAADLLNLAGGLYLVPRFVSHEDLGAVLPLTTFATFVAIPLFAIAMTALRESASLRASGEHQQLRIFTRGVFAAVGIFAILTLAVTAALLPHYLVRLHIDDSLAGYLVITAAFLGCVSPVYIDQLQAAKRFGCAGSIEVSAAAMRLAVMAVIMPFRALAGYFAGSVAKPLTQILGSLFILASGRGIIAKCGETCPPYWTRTNLLRLAKTFFLLLPYLALPILSSWMENDLVRTLLKSEDSAGYYMATRISDLMNYITYPILFVMFPYVTDKASRGESYQKTILRFTYSIICIAILGAVITGSFGQKIIALLPNGENYVNYAEHLPMLFLFMGFGAAQSIITNGEVAAGRFLFLWWLIPLNIAYVILMPRFMKTPSLGQLIAAFMLFALARLTCAVVQFKFSRTADASSDSDKNVR